MEIIFKRAYGRVKKPYHLDNNAFALYAPKAIHIEPATSRNIDTEIILILPNNSTVLSHQNLEEMKFISLMLKSNVCR